MSAEPIRPVWGPYNVITFGGPDGTKLESFQYSEVKGSQICVWASDNFASFSNQAGAETGYLYFMALVEVSIWGTVQSFEACIKRQAVRMVSGPMNLAIPCDLPWQRIEIRARNMTGGHPGLATDSGTEPPTNKTINTPFKKGIFPPSVQPNQSPGYYLRLNFSVQKVL